MYRGETKYGHDLFVILFCSPSGKRMVSPEEKITVPLQIYDPPNEFNPCALRLQRLSFHFTVV